MGKLDIIGELCATRKLTFIVSEMTQGIFADTAIMHVNSINYLNYSCYTSIKEFYV